MGSKKSAQAAKKAARMEKLMTAEQVKRLRVDQARDRSQVDVLQAASGFSDKSVTSQAYRSEFERLQQEEVKWLKLVGASRYNQQQSRAEAYKMEGIGRAFGDLAGMMNTYAQLQSNKTGR
jgi:type II secretory pathway component PulF